MGLQPVIFISKPDQAGQLHTHRQDLLATGRIIALTIDACARLSHLGYQFETLTDFLSLAEVDQLRRQATQLSETWFSTLVERAEHLGCNPFWLDRYFIQPIFAEVLVARAIFNAVENAMDQVVIFKSRNRPSLLDESSPDVANSVWLFMAEEENIEVILFDDLSRDVSTNGPRRLSKLPLLVNAIRSWLTNPLLKRLLFACLGFKSPVDLMLFVSLREASRYTPLAARLHEHFQNNFINTTTNHFSRLTFAYEKYEVTWNPIPTFLPEWRFIRARFHLKRVFQFWKDTRVQYSGEFPELFANPYLDFQFKHFFLQRCPRSVQAFHLARFFLRRFEAHTIITTEYAFDYQAEILEAAEQLDIQTITIPHSGIPIPASQLIVPDYRLVWSSDYTASWAQSGNPLAQHFQIGLPKDIVYNAYSQPALPTTEPDSVKTVVVLTTLLEMDIVAYVDARKHIKSLMTLIDVPQHLAGKLTTVFKLHPGTDHSALYQYIFEHGNPHLKVIKQGSLAEIIRRADVVLLVNMPTSAYLGALFEQKPIVFIHTGELTGWYFPFNDWGKDAIITSDIDVWATIERILFSDEARQNILNANRRFIHFLNPIGQDVYQSAIESIEAIRRQRKPE